MFKVNFVIYSQRQDILKAKFLSSDSGMSPANFFITHQFIDTVSTKFFYYEGYVTVFSGV